MNIPTTIAIKSIAFYQKELSHKKTYCCAHGALYQGRTCSEYCKQQIENAGLLIGLKSAFFRLKECYYASKKIETLRAEAMNKGGNGQSQKRLKNEKIDTCTKFQIAADSACCFLTFWPA